MSKIVIVGGGIAGLTAGIFAQKYGFESEIFEKNANAGGECTGWSRNGFHIDNCIHWLTGTKKSTELYTLWKEIGALGDDVEMVEFDRFYTSFFDEKKAVLWRDKERTRKELRKLGRSDGKAIDEFIKTVTALERLEMPVEKPFDMMSAMEKMKLGIAMFGALKYVKKYGKVSLKEYAGKFQSPLLRQFFQDYMDSSFNALSLMTSYASFTAGNGNVPKGGSVEMVKRIAEKYQSLGGVIHTKSAVEKVEIDGTKATGITLADGKTIKADYVICACDTSVTFHKLMDRKYMPKQLEKNYEKLKVQSAFQASFSVDDECAFIHNTEVFPCREITIGKSVFERMSVKSYWYEPKFSPVGKAVLQVHFTQTEDDYEYWKNLYETDKNAYKKKKLEIAEEIILSISAQYQQINGKIEVLDVLTPYTYNQWTGAYKGSYMSFVMSPKAMEQKNLTGIIDGLENVVLASQWQEIPGGLPYAAAAGKFAVQRIAKI